MKLRPQDLIPGCLKPAEATMARHSVIRKRDAVHSLEDEDLQRVYVVFHYTYWPSGSSFIERRKERNPSRDLKNGSSARR